MERRLGISVRDKTRQGITKLRFGLLRTNPGQVGRSSVGALVAPRLPGSHDGLLQHANVGGTGMLGRNTWPLHSTALPLLRNGLDRAFVSLGRGHCTGRGALLQHRCIHTALTHHCRQARMLQSKVRLRQ